MKKKTADRMPFDKSTSGAHTMELATKEVAPTEEAPEGVKNLFALKCALK